MANQQESKPCWQIAFLPKPTPCFTRAGGVPCEAPGCPVDDAVAQLQAKGKQVTLDQITQLCHSVCRISSLSEDNGEYIDRMSEQGETHILSILE